MSMGLTCLAMTAFHAGRVAGRQRRQRNPSWKFGGLSNFKTMLFGETPIRVESRHGENNYHPIALDTNGLAGECFWLSNGHIQSTISPCLGIYI